MNQNEPSDRNECRADEELGLFTQVPNSLFDQDISHTAKLVYIILLRFCRWGTGTGAYPSMRTIAKQASLSEGTVRLAIHDLEEHSLVTVTPRQRVDGSCTSNLFQLHYPKKREIETPPSKSEGGTANIEGGGSESEGHERDTSNERQGTISSPAAAPQEGSWISKALADTRERERKQRAFRKPDAEDEPTGWQRPETPDDTEFLEACSARRFEQGQKKQIRQLTKLMAVSDLLGAEGLMVLRTYLENSTGPLDAVAMPCLPRTWWAMRLEQARTHGWSRAVLLRNLLHRDRLMEHVRKSVRESARKGGAQRNDETDPVVHFEPGYDPLAEPPGAPTVSVDGGRAPGSGAGDLYPAGGHRPAQTAGIGAGVQVPALPG